MIRYALSCENAHLFDAWFRSSADYDAQEARGLLECPHCASKTVVKALMAPRVVTHDEPARPAPAMPPAPVVAAPPVPPPVPVPPPLAAALATPEGREIVGKLRELKAKMLENSENVGNRFAEEARRIHYGEAPARVVHGEATADDARALLEEGVGILPLPVLPDDLN